MLKVFVEEIRKCASILEGQKSIRAVYRKQVGGHKELDLLVSKVGDTSYGGLEVMIE